VDSNGDGDIDAVLAIYGAPNEVWTNNGSAQWTLASSAIGGSTYTMDIALGDVDRDGDLDLVTCDYSAQGYAYLNDGAGGFSTPLTYGGGLDKCLA